jgi:hypothetical protein
VSSRPPSERRRRPETRKAPARTAAIQRSLSHSAALRSQMLGSALCCTRFRVIQGPPAEEIATAVPRAGGCSPADRIRSRPNFGWHPAGDSFPYSARRPLDSGSGLQTGWTPPGPPVHTREVGFQRVSDDGPWQGSSTTPVAHQLLNSQVLHTQPAANPTGGDTYGNTAPCA